MYWWAPAAIGAGIGILNQPREQQEFKDQRNVMAAMAGGSPWTGIAPPNGGIMNAPGGMLDSALAGGLKGLGVSEAYGISDIKSLLGGGRDASLDEHKKAVDQGQSPYSQIAVRGQWA